MRQINLGYNPAGIALNIAFIILQSIILDIPRIIKITLKARFHRAFVYSQIDSSASTYPFVETVDEGMASESARTASFSFAREVARERHLDLAS